MAKIQARKIETTEIVLILTESECIALADALSYYVLARSGDEQDAEEKIGVRLARAIGRKLEDI